MNIINLIVGTPLAILIDLCERITGNYGQALLLFTLLTRIILFPFTYISHKNSFTLLKIQPELEIIKARHAGELSTILAEQKALYKREKYSTFKALLPMLLQIIIVLGVIGVVNNSIADGTSDFAFFGVDLSEVPKFSLTSVSVAVPLLSAVTAFFLCFTQNALNPLAKSQGFAGKWGTAIFLTAFSGYFAAVVQAGVGLYWIAGNIFGILTTVLCVVIYNPKKLLGKENYQKLLNTRKPKLSKAEKIALSQQKSAEKAREKTDVARFYSAKKQLVFYSEAGGFYKYFKHYIDYVLENSDIVVHYVTSDINDRVFEIERKGFAAYFCGKNTLITLFMKMETELFVMTMPDLDRFHYKRSLVKKDIEYIYTDHGFGSMNLMLRKGALDRFDTIFCYGKHHNEEIRATEEYYSLPQKKLVNTGFGLFYELERAAELSKQSQSKQAETSPTVKSTKPQILIAPSWQKDNILEYCLDALVEAVATEKYKVVIRPHPEFVKRFPREMDSLIQKHSHRFSDDFEIQTDFSSNTTVEQSDIVITDWSSIAMEFSFTSKKPSLFINTPMKIMNPDWEKIDVTPFDIRIRDEIGKSVDVEELHSLPEIIGELLDRTDDYRDKIARIYDECVYNNRDSSEKIAGGEYLVNKIKEHDNGISDRKST
ncbi:MAG: YidC/Oxa1 family membrane protein insertase [Oscillospiraceae bacterium]|nr:YidC/Oxa1 family membrane protein insertase [Oscillospiraceae bacterium]